ncbi:MAG: NADH-quinone oxidoreductase subunit L [Candidatus Binatia bacterium]
MTDPHHSVELVVQANHLLRWIPLVPLFGALVNFFFGTRIQKRAGRAGVALVACGASLLSFVLVAVSFLRLVGSPESSRLFIDRLGAWIHIGSLDVALAFQFDPLSAVMTLVVTGIGSLIHLYSYGYMDDEPAAWRFFALLNLFMFAMLTLVLGDNVLLMFVGWEGVGLCSWALIGFWHQDHVNTTAGNKAFIVNRIGDFGFLIGMMMLFWAMNAAGHGSLTFRELAANAGQLEGMLVWGVPVATLVTLFLFIGATGKSAQIPLYVWLPDAMAGPTPVSALIHAATMVTAGVYMIGRFSFIFSMAPDTMAVVATVGALTAFFAATIGVAQNDIKKVLAYSTVSQLGYMFIAMGVGAYAAGIFHLMTHAFFKACLFLGSGSVIHAMHHEQDMRNMGGLKRYMPRTFWTFLIATIAISGVPGTAGFFSKDEILWQAYLHDPLLWGLGFAGAGITAFYMFRLVFMTFYGECRADEHTRAHLHESSGWMTWPLVLLAGGSLLAGFLGVPLALGGSNVFAHFLEPVVGHVGHEGHHSLALEYGLMTASVGIAALGIVLAWLIYRRGVLSAESFASAGRGWPYRLFLNKYYVDELYHATFVSGTLALSRVLAWVDSRVVDGVVNGAAWVTRLGSRFNGFFDNLIVDGLVNLIARVVHTTGGAVRRIQTGSINAYLYVIVFVVAAVLFARTW